MTVLSFIKRSRHRPKHGSKRNVAAASDNLEPQISTPIEENSGNCRRLHHDLGNNRADSEHSEAKPKLSSSPPSSLSPLPLSASLNLINIPFDIVVEIFRHLPVSTIILLSQTCRTFREDLIRISANEILKLSKSQCVDVLVGITGGLLNFRQCANCMKMFKNETKSERARRCRLFEPFRYSFPILKDNANNISSSPSSVSFVPYSSPFFSDLSASVWICCCPSPDQRTDASCWSQLYERYCYEFCFRGCCCVEEREQLAFNQVRLVLRNARRMQQENVAENEEVSKKDGEQEGLEGINDLYSDYGYHDLRLVSFSWASPSERVAVKLKYFVIPAEAKRGVSEQTARHTTSNKLTHSTIIFTPGILLVSSSSLPFFGICSHLEYLPLATKSNVKSFTYFVRYAISMEDTRVSWGCEFCTTDYTLFFLNGKLRCSFWQELRWTGCPISRSTRWRKPSAFGERPFDCLRFEWDISKFSCIAHKYNMLVKK